MARRYDCPSFNLEALSTFSLYLAHQAWVAPSRRSVPEAEGFPRPLRTQGYSFL